MWYVETSEYKGNGIWERQPPVEFDTEKEANAFAEIVNVNLQFAAYVGSTRVTKIYYKEIEA